MVDIGFKQALEIQALAEHVHYDIHVLAQFLRGHLPFDVCLVGDDRTADQIQAQPDAVFGVGDAGDLGEPQINAVQQREAQKGDHKQRADEF